jgi:serine/threonine-protein kinase RsbW
MKKITVAAAIDQLDNVQNFISEQLEFVDCPVKESTQISIAIDEIISNIVYYAYPGSNGNVEVSCDASADRVTIVIEDSGIPYNPLEKEDPNVTLSAEERDIGGLGIFMVKKTMDEVFYEYKNKKNIITITKYINN